ncbi:MAG: type IV toxin-antitoxin system AbiEi family antitoxin domain-containing protein [Chthoniobacterales bacterium]|nr:type IV toxin-antitoxin system AbiEi family antitoxin domain-containing protein [Chthoniobacterales bacterium]
MPLTLPKALKKAPVQRMRDLESLGLSRPRVRSLVDQGVLEKASRGLYILRSADVTENRTLAEVGKRVPHGVICLLSALRFHDLTTQSPHEVWIALERSAWSPKLEHLNLRIVRFSGIAFEEGHQEHIIEGVPVQITSPAKTVADCFKYRNKIGIDVALEALRQVRRKRLCSLDELMHFARICRVANVMKPYLEFLD